MSLNYELAHRSYNQMHKVVLLLGVWLLLFREIVSQCVVGTGDMCAQCNQENGLCKACNDGYFLENFPSTKCVACPENCLSCNIRAAYSGKNSTAPINCNRCESSVSQQRLVVSNWRFSDSWAYTCGICSIRNCQTCESSTTCSACLPGLVLSGSKTECTEPQSTLFPPIANCLALNSVGKCYECKIGYTTSEDSSECVYCSLDNCRVCHNTKGKCSECARGFVLQSDGKCRFVPNSNCAAVHVAIPDCAMCQDGYYWKSAEKQCTPCTSKYANCVNCTESFINACRVGYYKVKGTDGADDKCELCKLASCTSIQCMLTSSRCDSCNYEGVVLLNNDQDRCLTNTELPLLPNCEKTGASGACETCRVGFYSTGSTTGPDYCLACADTGCLSCSGGGANQCTQCAKTSAQGLPLGLVSGKCIYTDSKNCDTWQGSDVTSCSACKRFYFLFKSTDYKSLTPSKEMIACVLFDSRYCNRWSPSGEGLVCSASETMTGAHTGFDLNPMPDHEVCPQATTLTSNSKNPVCVNIAIENCKRAYGSNKRCHECLPGYFVNSNQAPDRDVCTACVSNCEVCLSASDCRKCRKGFTKRSVQGQPEQCVQTVPFCADYSEAEGICVRCAAGFILTAAATPSCVRQVGEGAIASFGVSPLHSRICADGYYLSGSACVRCSIPNCASCASPSTCTRCAPATYLSRSPSSPDSCTPIPINACLAALDSNTCTRCRSGYALPSMFRNTGSYCGACNVSHCSVCDSNSTLCDVCAVGYVLTADKKTCVVSTQNCADLLQGGSCARCTPGYFAIVSADTVTCLPCTAGCAECVSATQCSRCEAGKYLDTSQSVPRCLAGMAECAEAIDAKWCVHWRAGYTLQSATADSVIAKKCADNCNRCAVSSSDSVSNCVECNTGYYISGLATPSETCSQCPTGCYSCLTPALASASSFCTSCKAGFYLVQGTCTPVPTGGQSTSDDNVDPNPSGPRLLGEDPIATYFSSWRDWSFNPYGPQKRTDGNNDGQKTGGSATTLSAASLVFFGLTILLH